MVLKGQVARGWLGRTTGVSVPLTVSSGWRRQPHLAQGQPAGAHELTEVAPQMKERGVRRLTPIMGDAMALDLQQTRSPDRYSLGITSGDNPPHLRWQGGDEVAFRPTLATLRMALV